MQFQYNIELERKGELKLYPTEVAAPSKDCSFDFYLKLIEIKYKEIILSN